MLKNIFVISDVELGQGDIFDDFKDEASLIGFLKKITAQPGKNILVMNGDSFDFLKMPYKGYFTHHVTEEVSVWKMERIIETYPKIFQALKDFVHKGGNKIQFNYGNHDFDLLWPGVQKKIRDTLGDGNKITFDDMYDNKEVHIEHGHQVDYFYKMDPDKRFINHKGQLLLNLPIGSVAVIKYFVELKRHFPVEEAIYPRHQAFESFPEFRKMKQRISRDFILKGLLFNFITSTGDPVSNIPYTNLIKHILAHGLEIHDEAKFMRKRFKNIVKLYPDKKVYIMGHLHITHHDIHPTQDHVHIVTDTWRNELRIQRKQTLTKVKNYAKIVYENDQLKKVDLLTYT